jgi:hypothetical protein
MTGSITDMIELFVYLAVLLGVCGVAAAMSAGDA